MAAFAYTARSRAGQKVEGRIEAADRRAALAQLARMDCVPISVSEAGGGASAAPAPKAGPAAAPGGKPGAKPAASPAPKPAAKPALKPAPKPAPKPAAKAAPKAGAKPAAKGAEVAFSWSFRGDARPRLRMKDLLLFTRELSDLLASGMTLGDALHTLAQRGEGSRGVAPLVTELRDEIVRGSSLSEALATHPESFPNLYVSMVRAGEAGGSLGQALERLAEHYERTQDAKEKVMSALAYPAIVLTIGIGTMIFIMIFVIPRFAKMFAELGSTLPLPTRMLIGLSGWLSGARGFVVLGVVLLSVFMARRALKTERGRRWWHRAQLRLPVVRHIISASAYAHFAQTLGSLLSNGVPVLQALAIVENTIGNLIISEQIHEARDRVTDGSSISVPLAAGKVFPPLLTDMLAVGERTGDMAGALGHIARRYENERDRSVKLFITILEPLLIVLVAGMVGFVAISMLLAVFDLTSGLNV